MPSSEILVELRMRFSLHTCLMQEDARWKLFQISQDYLEEKSRWLSEQRNLNAQSLMFFADAGKLLSLARSDYVLSNLVFFLAILGVERAMRSHYRTEEKPFKYLFNQAVTEGIICDAIFHRIEPLSKDLEKQTEKSAKSHSHKLVSLIPHLRNSFLHGSYSLHPEYLCLALQMREIADVLRTRHELGRQS